MATIDSIANLWSIILAGGEGERTRPFIEQWMGRHVPKQYCAFVGTRSMLQHTWDRADCLTASNQKITVVARNHRPVAWKHFESSRRGQILFQPENRDTAAGIFLPVTYVRAWNPDATIVIYPSDHFVYPEEEYLATVQRTIGAAERLADRIILLGVSPTSLEKEYGWIEPEDILGWSGGFPVRGVSRFLEKPDHQQAIGAIARGGLWNTLVMASKVETMWNLGWRCLPDLMAGFEELGKAIGTSREGPTLEAVYQNMPRFNFSSHLLQCLPEYVGVVELKDVLWSDWGRLQRIVDTLRVIGRTPAFPVDDDVVPGGKPAGPHEPLKEVCR